MFNPFKLRYTIEEFKNTNGQTLFVSKYSNLFWDFMCCLDRIDIYVTLSGELSGWEIRHQCLDNAKQAIENHKTMEKEKQNAKYKKLAIHYVD